MFDFFKFRHNNGGAIKAGAQSALFLIAYQCIKNYEEHPLPAIGGIVMCITLSLCLTPRRPDVIHKSQPGENGFYLHVDSNQQFKMQ